MHLVKARGPTTGSIAIAGVRVGDGIVTEIALPGFAARLATDAGARELLGGIWSRLSS